jgi:hypothetical protein
MYFFVAQQPSKGLGHLIVQVSRSHTIETHKSVRGRTPLNE